MIKTRNAYILLSLFLCLTLFCPVISEAASSERSYILVLKANGDYSTVVNVGDEITLQVKLERKDEGKSGSYALYAVQDEIIYDSSYFSLLESGKAVAEGYGFNVRDMADGIRKCIILSRLAGAGQREGIATEDSLVIATFKLKVIAGKGQITEIISKNYKISTEDSTTTDIITSNNVTVTISDTVIPITYTVTFTGGEGAKGTAPSVGAKEAGTRFALPANTFTRDGYDFTGWHDGSKTYAAGASYTMPAHAVTFTAQWKKSSGTGGPPGGGGVLTPPIKPEPEKPVDVSITIKGTTATLDMEAEELTSLLKETTDAGPITLDLSDKKVSSLDIPSGALKAISQAAKAKEGLQVALPKGTIELDKVTLDELSKVTEKGHLKISIDDAKVLTPEQQAVVKDKPVYDIRVETDAGAVVGLKGKAIIYLPYELKVDQSAAGVVVYYVDSDGSLVDMKAQYDPVKKVAYFTTDHLSVYMVAYDASLVKVSPADRYTDVDVSAWYYEAVEYALEKGLFVGTSETTFSPNTAMSRAMLVTVLWRMESEPAVISANSFTDVAADAWYAKPVLWANANNIVSGYGGGLFGPDDNITREQMAAILNRYAGFKGYDVSVADNLAVYADAGHVSDWALASMKWAVGEKLITGMTTTTLVPQGNATRAQVATILMRYIENVVE
jgi:uncharacterized repeat protein (TIGR02543 family)